MTQECKIRSVRKILPIITNPPVTVYKNYAYPLCIIYAEEWWENWSCNHFSNVYLMKNKNNYVWFDFLESNEWAEGVLEIEHIKLEELEEIDINTLICDAIDKNQYVSIFLDEFFMKNSNQVGREHIPGEFFIYGYDKEKECFYMVGFNSSSIFGELIYSYDEVKEAFNSLRYHRERFSTIPTWVLWYTVSKMSEKDYICNTIDVEKVVKAIFFLKMVKDYYYVSGFIKITTDTMKIVSVVWFAHYICSSSKWKIVQLNFYN